MSIREIKKVEREDLNDIIDGLFSQDSDSGFLDDDKASAGFFDTLTNQSYKHIEREARLLEEPGFDFLQKIAAMAIGYDKTSNFSRAKEILSSASHEPNFKQRVQKMIRSYKIALSTRSANDAIGYSLDSFFKTYEKDVGFDSKIEKISQDLTGDPKFVALKISEIVNIMLSRMKLESRPKSRLKIREKIRGFDVLELANKKSPGGAAIGVSLALIKNILIAKDSFFINRVLEELEVILR